VCSVTINTAYFTNSEFKSVDKIEVSSLDILQFDVEDFAIRATQENQAVVDEVSESPDGICVYVKKIITKYISGTKMNILVQQNMIY